MDERQKYIQYLSNERKQLKVALGGVLNASYRNHLEFLDKMYEYVLLKLIMECEDG